MVFAFDHAGNCSLMAQIYFWKFDVQLVDLVQRSNDFWVLESNVQRTIFIKKAQICFSHVKIKFHSIISDNRRSLVLSLIVSMASILKLQVITGAFDEGPLAYLLQTDDFRFLLDCGWDERFSMEIIEEYKR